MSRERLKVFVSSKMDELADERCEIKKALKQIEIDAWVFEADAGSRPKSIHDTYLDELEGSDVYIGLFWKGYGEYTVDEFNNARKLSKDCLIYEKRIELDQRDPRLQEFLDELSNVESGLTIRWFQDAEQLSQFIKQDIADLLTRAYRSPSKFASTVFQVPYQRNPRFVGRDQMLQDLSAVLDSNVSEVNVFVLAGIGGIGKTQLAVEFAHRYVNLFPGGIFWLSMKNAGYVSRQVAKCAGPGALDLPNYEKWSLEDRIAAVKRAWQQPISRLIVFDNCESEDLVADWCPTVGRCTILVTSRRPEWESTLITKIVKLDVLPREESISLLKQYSRHLAVGYDDDLAAIAAELGYLPLALHLAGSYLARYHNAIKPTKYLTQLIDKEVLEHKSLQLTGKTPTGHEQNLALTFYISLNKLNPEDDSDSKALALLARAAKFAPGEPIPRYMLYQTLPRTTNDKNKRVKLSAEESAKQIIEAELCRLNQTTDEEFEDALKRLIELGFIDTFHEAALWMHCLVAAFVDEYISDEQSLKDVWRLLYRTLHSPEHKGQIKPRLYFEVLWKQVENIGHQGYDILPHLLHAMDLGLERKKKWAFDHARALGMGLLSAGDYSKARNYLERVLKFDESSSKDLDKIGRDLTDLGLLEQTEGDLVKARKHFERALEIQENLYGADHPLLGTPLNNLGNLLYQQRDFDTAYKYLKRALEVRGRPYDRNDSTPASILNNLGLVLWEQEKLPEAKEHLERGFEYCKYMFAGYVHEAIALAANLAELLKNQRNSVGAREYLERAISISEVVHGADALITGRNYLKLGEFLRDQGALAGAREYIKKALVVREHLLPPDDTTLEQLRAQITQLDSSGNKDS